MAKKAKKPVPGPGPEKVTISLYFTREGFTEPDMDDIHYVMVPKSICSDPIDLYTVLEYIQSLDPDDSCLSEKLNDKEYVSSIRQVRVEVRKIDCNISEDTRKNLLMNLEENLYSELDELMDNFFRDNNIPDEDRSKFMENYMINRY